MKKIYILYYFLFILQIKYKYDITYKLSLPLDMLPYYCRIYIYHNLFHQSNINVFVKISLLLLLLGYFISFANPSFGKFFLFSSRNTSNVCPWKIYCMHVQNLYIYIYIYIYIYKIHFKKLISHDKVVY